MQEAARLTTAADASSLDPSMAASRHRPDRCEHAARDAAVPTETEGENVGDLRSGLADEEIERGRAVWSSDATVVGPWCKVAIACPVGVGA